MWNDDNNARRGREDGMSELTRDEIARLRALDEGGGITALLDVIEAMHERAHDEGDELTDTQALAKQTALALAIDLPALLAAWEAGEEARLSLLAERGHPAGAMPGWSWHEGTTSWVSSCHHGMIEVWRKAPGVWGWHIEESDEGTAPTAREAMRAADAAWGEG